MKNQSMYIRLQNQYKKLNSRIQKAIKNGRFYGYTQFKQEQLFARLKRYSLQLKQVAAGVAVVGALGVATPAVGQVTQYNLVEHTGTANPLSGLNPQFLNRPIFVDIDNDGDQDLFLEGWTASTDNIMGYYENTGTVNAPNFVAQTGANNPLDGIGNGKFTTFVDIDNDGDMDCFRGNHAYYNDADCFYYKNEGTASTPNFVLQPDSLNPMDSVVSHLDALPIPATFVWLAPMLSFVDIDNDGDMDCFAAVYTYGSYSGPEDIWYYENVGTAITPSFMRQTEVNNPLGNTEVILNSLYYTNKQSIVFKDTDKDGDMDAILTSTGGTGVGAPLPTRHTPFFENQGTANNPNFVLSTNTPIDSAFTGSVSYKQTYALVDIDGDNDLDVFRVAINADSIAFFENMDTTTLSITEIEEASFSIFPNPTTGLVYFEKSIEGQASIYNELGQNIYVKELKNEQYLNLSKLGNGIYFLVIETDKERIRKTILIEK
jgi:hypothetical protein